MEDSTCDVTQPVIVCVCFSCERGEPRGSPERPGGRVGAPRGRLGGSGSEGRPVAGGVPQRQAAADMGVEEQAIQAHEDRLPACA